MFIRTGVYRVRRANGSFVVINRWERSFGLVGRRLTPFPDLISARSAARDDARRSAEITPEYRLEKYSPDAFGWILIERFRVENGFSHTVVDGVVTSSRRATTNERCGARGCARWRKRHPL